ncbi:MAG TPA: hypothetical protein VFS05_06790 [Gemmatimonadaceae bacterium]|nr:hypothetical protein [Gemmatimonadaceae bacterium]
MSERAMASARLLLPASCFLLSLLAACSPEARRERDGGPGADPGNKILVAAPRVNPRAADTTLWPGRNPAPVERLAHGQMPPPAGVSPASLPAASSTTPVTPSVPASRSEQETYQRGTSANPRQPSSPPAKAPSRPSARPAAPPRAPGR